ncbi:MAG: methyltransferase domain-containing protein [Haloarculaceae archaeon]
MPDDIGTFHRWARLYDLFMLPPDPDELAAALGTTDRPVERVLDVGGGPGRAVETVEASTRIVVDPAGGMVARARTHGLAGVQADGARLPFGDDTVDAILVSDALHHIRDQTRLLAEAARVLGPGGVLVVRDFDPSTLRGRLLVAGEHLFGFESVFHTPETLASMLADAGLDPSVTTSGFAYTVVARAAAAEG